MSRKVIPNRRESVTQSFRVLPTRRVYISTSGEPPQEIFLRIKGGEASSEVVALYDIVARLASLALQHGVPIVEIGAMLRGVSVEPAGVVHGYERIKFCTSVPDVIGRYLLLQYGTEE